MKKSSKGMQYTRRGAEVALYVLPTDVEISLLLYRNGFYSRGM